MELQTSTHYPITETSHSEVLYVVEKINCSDVAIIPDSVFSCLIRTSFIMEDEDFEL